MEQARFRPRAQLFVCANLRASTDPLQSACGGHGTMVFTALKRAVAEAGLTSSVWVTRTGCLGHCPPRGCSVVVHPGNEQLINVTVADADSLVQRVQLRLREGG